ncbi:MAG: porin [Campylobacteraceae bacterium]|nr:porin [Campylobacteraceae bacterium]
MKRKLLLLTTISASLLSANTLEEALSSGSFEGEIAAYTEYKDNKVDENSAFSMGYLNLMYQSGYFHGFNTTVGFRANSKLNEKHKGDYDGGESLPKALLHTANISYNHDLFDFTIGRGELDYEWATDFHEGAILRLKPLQDLILSVGHSRKVATVDEDEPMTNFERFNKKDGLWFFDLTYDGIEDSTINLYSYSVNNIASWYGGGFWYDNEFFGFTAKGAVSDEKKYGQEHDGHIYNLELRGKLDDFVLSGGYIATDKKGGVGSMEIAGESINPLDEGDKVYEADAKTYYIGAEYEYGDFSFETIYAHTKFKDEELKKKEKEFNFIAEYEIVKNLNIGALYAKIKSDEKDESYSKYSLNLRYNF